MGHQESDPHRGDALSRNNIAWNSLELGLAALGVVLIVLGALVGKHWETQIDKKFQEEMVLSPTSEGVEEWKSPTVPIITRMYFWNWTNPSGINEPGYKPAFDEIGPYTFSEKHKKVNLTWHDNGTVSYRFVKHWYFEPELSVGNITDSITTVNVIAVAMSTLVLNAPGTAQRALSWALVTMRQKLTWTKTVSELTFKGFSNPLQTFGSLVSSAKDKFGFFYDMNGTVSPDVNSMSTGALDIYTLGEIDLFNYKNSTPAHNGSCSKYRGGAGELWPPHRTPESVLTMFTPDMCRPISYYYEGKSSHNGIPSLVFSSTAKTIDNGTLVEENKCFCNEKGCEPSGLYDLRSCKDGAPIFMSLPHFYLADPVYREGVVGMRPEPERHKFYMELEPRTAVPLKVAARLQLNVKISKNPRISMFKNVPDVLVPIWWMETVVALPVTHTSGVQLLLTIIYIGPFIAGIVISIGVLIILILMIKRYLWMPRKARKSKNKIIDDEKSSAVLLRDFTIKSTNDGRGSSSNSKSSKPSNFIKR